MFRRLSPLVSALLLSACYGSPSDLIGDHANVIERFDSLVVLSGQAYQVVTHGKSAMACGISTRADLTKPCVNGFEVKMERTGYGNYIVQIKGGDSYRYALWMRSDPGKLSAARPCVLWLGDGAVGSPGLSAISAQHAGEPAWDTFVTKLRSIASEPPINRSQLLAIVKAYEGRVVDLTAQQWQCFGDRATIENSEIAIQGDNRHLRAFVPPPVN